MIAWRASVSTIRIYKHLCKTWRFQRYSWYSLVHLAVSILPYGKHAWHGGNWWRRILFPSGAGIFAARVAGVCVQWKQVAKLMGGWGESCVAKFRTVIMVYFIAIIDYYYRISDWIIGRDLSYLRVECMNYKFADSEFNGKYDFTYLIMNLQNSENLVLTQFHRNLRCIVVLYILLH